MHDGKNDARGRKKAQQTHAVKLCFGKSGKINLCALFEIDKLFFFFTDFYFLDPLTLLTLGKELADDHVRRSSRVV